jgi:hypothetical protein
LGAGIAFRYLGAARYSGVELNVGNEFNTWSTLNSIEILTRIKYGKFLDNFNGVPLNFVEPGSLSDNVSLASRGINLVKVESFTSIDLPDNTADMIYSNFTFEHIQNPAIMSVEIARLLKPGAITAHFIDIEDHSDFSQPFNYLAFEDEEWEARYNEDGGQPMWLYQNRCRASDFRNFFEQAGLKILEYTPLRSAAIDPELLERLAPRFREYDLEDLQIVWLMIIAAKPE